MYGQHAACVDLLDDEVQSAGVPQDHAGLGNDLARLNPSTVHWALTP